MILHGSLLLILLNFWVNLKHSVRKSIKPEDSNNFLHGTKSDFETGKGCVFNEQNLPVSKTHSLVIKPQEVNFK